MGINPMALTIRAKKLGVLIRDARLSTQKTIQECAAVIGVPAEVFAEYELGEKSPSLPELEALAYWLKIPLAHFWEDRTITPSDGKSAQTLEQWVALRQRIIGAMIRKARLEAGMSVDELAQRAVSAPDLVETFELGDQPIPLPDLEILCSALGLSLKEFQDKKGKIGTWETQQHSFGKFLELDAELQDFVSRPVNRPYLEIAQKLSEMRVDQLRAVAEGLLAITF